MQAQRLHARLRTDYNRPIDIFGVVQELGIWLSSRPLGAGLFGFYLREGDAVGIVLNAGHPEYLQRYTCAHELGHHVLGHHSHLDERADIVGDAPADRHDEHTAQMFAGNFLMPIQAVNRVQRRLGIPRDHATPAQVYALSRELDVSFSAAAWQLVNLGRLSTRRAAEMVRAGAAAAKRTMRPGPHPQDDNRAGLVVIEETGRDLPVLVRPGDELRIRVPENASTGYLWELGTPHDDQPPERLSWDGGAGIDTAAGAEIPARQEPPVQLVGDNYSDPTSSDSNAARSDVAAAIGTAAGEREFVFLANQPGRHDVVLSLRRPWEQADIRDILTTRVRVGPRHTLNGIAEQQVRGHVARLAEGGRE